MTSESRLYCEVCGERQREMRPPEYNRGRLEPGLQVHDRDCAGCRYSHRVCSHCVRRLRLLGPDFSRTASFVTCPDASAVALAIMGEFE